MLERPELTIDVDGTPLRVQAEQTVAAALLDHGAGFRTSVLGQPRGPVCGIGVCFECRVTIDDQPHQRACMRVVCDGMRVRTRA
jgi:sarcosine oxidase subunit alpha